MGERLLEDLTTRFHGYSLQGKHPSVRYRLRLADFGMANAWKDLAIPRGTLPYMAPEQYAPREFAGFAPDTFAVGVILSEMLTGNHPSGVPIKAFRNWKDTKRENWAKTGSRVIRVGKSDPTGKIEPFLHRLLLPNPTDRPTLEEGCRVATSILAALDPATHEQVRLLCEYYDALAEHNRDADRLDGLMQLANLHGQLSVVIVELLQEIADCEDALGSAKAVVYYCDLCYRAGELLLRDGSPESRKRVARLAEGIVNQALKWRQMITTAVVYPSWAFRETRLLSTPPFRDFESYRSVLCQGIDLLNEVEGRVATESRFAVLDEHARCVFFYHRASQLHGGGDDAQAIQLLDKCIELNGNEAVLYYMKAMWSLMLNVILRTLKRGGEAVEEARILEDVQRAIELDPTWEEPKALLKKFGVKS